MTTSTKTLICLLATIACTTTVNIVQAALWTGTVNTDWNEAGNWNPPGVPGEGEQADLQMTGADYTINYGSPMLADSVGGVLIDNDEEYTTTLNINAAGFNSEESGAHGLTVGQNGAMVVGAGGDATMKAVWSSSLSAMHSIAGNLTVDGGSLTLDSENYAFIHNGGTVTLNSGSLTFNIREVYPYCHLRMRNEATLNINGGVATIYNLLYLGYIGGNTQTLTMTDGTLNLNRSIIGARDDTGIMNIQGGEVNSAGILEIGQEHYTGGTGTLNLSGGSWEQTNGSLVMIGIGQGTPQLNVTGTGAFTTTGNTLLGQIVPGWADSAYATLLVNGGSYTATNNDGTASITVRRGALDLQNGSLTIDNLVANHRDEGTSTSSVTFDGGTMAINQSTDIDNDTVFQVGDGTKSALLVLNGGTHSFADGLSVTNNAALQGTGTITTPADTTSTSVASGGTLIPGNSIGTLTITNDLSIANGAGFDYEISSSTVHDLVAVGGDLELPGDGSALTLNLSLVDPKKVLSPADVELFTYGTLSGYTDVNWTINLIGDYWLGTPSVSDDGNGTIYLNGITFIPEPASIALLGLGLLTLMRRNRKH